MLKSRDRPPLFPLHISHYAEIAAVIDTIGGMGNIYLSNIVVHQQRNHRIVVRRARDSIGSGESAPGPVLRYDAVSSSNGPNISSLSGSTIFIRPPPNASISTAALTRSRSSTDDGGCGSTITAVASLDGKASGGRLFGQQIFGNLSFVCCTPAYMASHPHFWQDYDGCRQ